jgi:uncharacterized protein (TIGR00725 family)
MAPYVAVVGGGRASDDECRVAEEVGRLLAGHGVVVVCGGLDGVMAAACRGAKTAGGTTVGILPGTDRAGANEWVDIAVATGMGEGRNALVARTADAMIAIGGEFGTLSEIALALRAGKAVVGIGTWELARQGRPVEAVIPVLDAATAVDVALAGLSPG